MTDDRWPRVKELFEAAVELPLSERSTFLSSAVAGDEILRHELESLLVADRVGETISEGRRSRHRIWVTSHRRV
jgi:hypothetical protein